jgi:ABC-type nitrate/sulfonate/bicarbonate transport system ATPase subunit
MLCLKKIGKQFENGRVALREISLEISPRTIVSVVGASGSGKSTLLRIVSGLVSEAIRKVGLTPFASAFPRELSGGMAQRVAIARALVARPSLILMDEPFSALDAVNRLKLQNHLLQIWQADRPTLLVVTHDVEEAVFFGDRVIVLERNSGRIKDDYTIDLPRPRQRVGTQFQHWKETVLKSLDPALIEDADSVEQEKYA